MTSYLSLYANRCADLLRQAPARRRSFRLFRLGLLPHEIAALNAR